MSFRPTQEQLELIAEHAAGHMPVEATAKALDIPLADFVAWLRALHKAVAGMGKGRTPSPRPASGLAWPPRPPILSQEQARYLSRVCHRMMPVLETVDVETQDVLAKICADRPITQEDGVALATALLLELQRRRPARAPRR